MLSVTDLRKTYGDVAAVDGVGFSVAEGEIFGLLGPNGAGKTTTISMISCLIAPDAGEISIDGHSTRTDSLGARKILGVVPQEIALYPLLTAAENLAFWGRMYGLKGKRLAEAVEYGLALAGLEDKAKKRVETFSGGMKRRINIAVGVLHRPRVLLMDEPTVGIDPQSRNHILGLVRELNKGGMTILYTSHYMEEVEALCDRIAIMDHGRVIALGTLGELRRVVGGMDIVTAEVAEIPPKALAGIRALEGVDRAEIAEGSLKVFAADGGGVLAPLVQTLEAHGAHVSSVAVAKPDLESVFLHLTGKSLRD
ncbi:MAG: ABC transporter ATP-binding protein [Coriobacteriia bacterium]|nr:ABC transporter ATP-binding protein [Coriobacteriia bacterium]